MLKNLNIYILIALAILVCDFFFFEISEGWMVFDVFIRLALGFGAFVFLMTGLVIVLLHKRLWVPNFILFVSGFCFIVALYYGKKWWSEKDVFLNAYYDGGNNSILIKLFENNTFKIYDNGMMGGDVFKGRYRLSHDTVVLDSQYPLGKNRPFFTGRLLIKDSTLTIISSDSAAAKFNPVFKITQK